MTIQELKKGISNWRFTRERVIHLSIGLAAVLIYEFLARPIYRPYIYKHQINDFHVADTLGNSLGTVAAVFVLIAVLGQGRAQHLLLIKIITISLAVFEVAHPLLGKPIDPWDILATFLTGGLCLLLYRSIHPIGLDKEQRKKNLIN